MRTSAAPASHWISPLRQDTSFERRMSAWKTDSQGTAQGSGVSSPRACCSRMSSWAVAGQVAMADSV
jgi:hypothetical protein